MINLRGSRGFSLVEIMVAVGLLGGLALVVLNLTKQTTTTQKRFQTDVDADFIMKEIAGILAVSCNSSQIVGKNASSTAAGVITNINGKYLANNSTGYGTSNIKIVSYELSDTGFSEITDTTKETSLIINFATPKAVSSTASLIKPRRIKLIVTKNTGNVVTCQSAWSNQQDHWTKSGNNVFYNMGNVGIGTATPVVKLDVAGEIRPGGASTGGACAQEGAFAYDFGSHSPVFCSNAGVWTPMGGGLGTITVRSASATAWRWPSPYVACNPDEKVLGGGGVCSGGSGYNFVVNSTPSGNGWQLGCDTPNNQTTTGVVYAICAK